MATKTTPAPEAEPETTTPGSDDRLPGYTLDRNYTFTGNLTRDPELAFSASGLEITKLSVADTERKRTDKGEWVDAGTLFLNVVCFGELADHVATSVVKGNRVTVVGRLNQRQFVDNKFPVPGTDRFLTRNVLELVADDVSVSLKFATAEVTRISRSTAGDRVPDDVFTHEKDF